MQVSTMVAKARGPVSFFVLPGKMCLGGPAQHPWVLWMAPWLGITGLISAQRYLCLMIVC